MDLKPFFNFWDTIQNCDADFFTCGYNAGDAYSTLTQWYVPDNQQLQGADIDMSAIPTFLDGFVEGLACPKLLAAKEQLLNLILDITTLREGDFTVVNKLVEDWGVVSSTIESLELPKIDAEAFGANAVSHMF